MLNATIDLYWIARDLNKYHCESDQVGFAKSAAIRIMTARSSADEIFLNSTMMTRSSILTVKNYNACQFNILLYFPL
mgnify:CR=1 FL=1